MLHHVGASAQCTPFWANTAPKRTLTEKQWTATLAPAHLHCCGCRRQGVPARAQDNDIVLPSYRPGSSMYNAVLRACRVKWGTSSATWHPAGQQQKEQWCKVKYLKKKSAPSRHVRAAPPMLLLNSKGPAFALSNLRNPGTHERTATVFCLIAKAQPRSRASLKCHSREGLRAATHKHHTIQVPMTSHFTVHWPLLQQNSGWRSFGVASDGFGGEH